MDICMFAPAERKEVETLVAIYECARSELQSYLEKRMEIWGNEIVADDTDARDDFMLNQVVYRYDRAGKWLCQIIAAKITVAEIDTVITVDDDE